MGYGERKQTKRTEKKRKETKDRKKEKREREEMKCRKRGERERSLLLRTHNSRHTPLAARRETWKSDGQRSDLKTHIAHEHTYTP